MLRAYEAIGEQMNSDLFWNYTWQSAQWKALCTKITEVNLSVFVYRLLHEDFSSIIGTISDQISDGEKSS